MQTEESSLNVIQISPDTLKKLKILQGQLGVDDLNAALDKSLDIAHFVAETLDDPERKLLVEQRGKFQELKGLA